MAASSTTSTEHLVPGLIHSVVEKRQVPITTVTYSDRFNTLADGTYTHEAWTVTFAATTVTHDASTETITATTQTFTGETETIWQTIYTSHGSTYTNEFLVSTHDGTTVTIPIVQATTSAAYLYTGSLTAMAQASIQPTPTSLVGANSWTSEMSISVTGATISAAYLDLSHTSSTESLRPTPSALSFPETTRVVRGDYFAARYYVATYGPSILIILLKILWSPVFASVKLIEPFYQLRSDPRGAPLESSLLADYLSPTLRLKTLASLLTGKQPVMLMAVFITALITILAPIASETMSIRGAARCTIDGQTRSCLPVWTLDMICIRILQALLALVFVLAMGFTFATLRRQEYGLHADPSAISTVTMISNDEELKAEIRSLPPHASSRNIRRLLAGNRYALVSSSPSSSSSSQRLHPVIVKANNHDVVVDQRLAGPQHKHNQASSRFLLVHFPTFLLALLLLALILSYRFDNHSDSLNIFFNSQSFGPRFLLSVLATVLDNRFKRLEREVRVLTPWMTLFPSTTTTAHTGLESEKSDRAKGSALQEGVPGTCYSAVVWYISRGRLELAIMSLTAALGDVLIVAVAGVPFSEAEIYDAFVGSVWVSVGVLAMMLVVGAGCWVRLSRWKVKGGKDIGVPDTILGVAAAVLGREGGEIRERVCLMR